MTKWRKQGYNQIKQQAKQWVSPGKSVPKETKLDLSAYSDDLIFWFKRYIIHIDYLKMQVQSMAKLLDRFNEGLKKKRSYLAKNKVLYH